MLLKPLSEGLLSRLGGFERRSDLAKQWSTAMWKRMIAERDLMFFILRVSNIDRVLAEYKKPKVIDRRLLAAEIPRTLQSLFPERKTYY